MPAWSSGTWTRYYPAGWIFDAQAGNKIRADKMDNEWSYITAGFNNCITRDGYGKPSTANMDWNGAKLINLAPGVAPGDAVNMSQLVGAGTRSIIGSKCTLTGLSFVSGTLTVYPFDTKYIDVISEYNTTLYRFVPTTIGTYRISGNAAFLPQGTASYNFLVGIYINSSFLLGVYSRTENVTAGLPYAAPFSAIVKTNTPGDYLEVKATGTGGGWKPLDTGFISIDRIA